MSNKNNVKKLGGLVTLLLAMPMWATELVYVPVNPVFGGNPLNGSTLLGIAQAINTHTEDPNRPGLSGAGFTPPTALEQFNDILQRTILGRVAAATTSSIVGNDGRLIPGQVETTDFRINIVDLGGGLLQIVTTDKLTGASTSFQVSQ